MLHSTLMLAARTSLALHHPDSALAIRPRRSEDGDARFAVRDAERACRRSPTVEALAELQARRSRGRARRRRARPRRAAPRRWPRQSANARSRGVFSRCFVSGMRSSVVDVSRIWWRSSSRAFRHDR